MIVNDLMIQAEVEAEFAAYERALVDNDVAALDDFFVDRECAVRYGFGPYQHDRRSRGAKRAVRARPPGPVAGKGGLRGSEGRMRSVARGATICGARTKASGVARPLLVRPDFVGPPSPARGGGE